MTVGHLIVFKDGQRIDKRVHESRLKDAVEAVKMYRDHGFKAHLVYRTDRGTFPPPHQVEEMRFQGMLWCPYCRTWRWFSVPKFRSRAEVNTDAWFMNSFHRQGIKVCQWCHISEMDWWVRKVNGTWGESNHRRRRKKKKTV